MKLLYKLFFWLPYPPAIIWQFLLGAIPAMLFGAFLLGWDGYGSEKVLITVVAGIGVCIIGFFIHALKPR